MWIWIVLLGVVAVIGAIRLAPHNIARWHVAVQGAQDKDMKGGAIRVVSGDTDTILAVHDAMMEEPRTRVLTGDPRSGSVTYVTRSLVFGFPDYTTVEQTGHLMKIFGRSRFGGSDFGVNAKRLDRVLVRAGVR